MVEGEKLELCCVFSSQKIKWSLPDGAFSGGDIDFLPASNCLEMMADLRKTILATPEQVLELKAKLNC
jgi:hypothetical protein